VDALDALLVRLRAGLRAFGGDGEELDAAMDEVQVALAHVNDVVYDTFVRAAE
jgi:hypothetical protein